jgi:TrmH family RNA methyltransferase
MEPITSRSNERLKAVRRLQAKKHRLAAGLFLAEGEDIVVEALSAGILPAESFVAADALVARLGRGGAVHVVADALLGDLGTLGHPARVISVFRIGDLPQRPPAAALGVHLHRVIDPGNVGTVVRAAGALGPAFVSLSPGCSDPLSGKGVRASMGAVFRVPIALSADLPEDVELVALVPDGGDPVWACDLSRPLALVIGAERLGLPEDVIARCDQTCTVPLAKDAESLNAAAAAVVGLYEAVRQRAAA